MRRTLLVWNAGLALVFGLLTALPIADHGTAAYLLSAVARAAIWGLLTVPCLYWVVSRLDRRARARLRQPAKDFWAPVSARQTAAVALSLEHAFDRVHEAVLALPRSRITRADRDIGVIEARARMTWRSWGERIVIHFRPTGADSTSIDVRSTPLVSLTIADYGKNQENVDAVMAALRAP